MGKWKHRLSGLNEKDQTANCANCGPVRVVQKHGVWKCYPATRSWDHLSRPQKNKKSAWRKHVGEFCERCGWYPESPCQLDVHHKNGRAAGHDPPNLQTLCANCHRLATHAPSLF